MNLINYYKSNFHQWFAQKLKIENIENILNSDHSIGVEEKNNLIKQIKLKKGLILTGIGSFFCFVSCVFTMLNLFPELRGLILVGFTGFGVALILYGFYLIFE